MQFRISLSYFLGCVVVSISVLAVNTKSQTIINAAASAMAVAPEPPTPETKQPVSKLINIEADTLIEPGSPAASDFLPLRNTKAPTLLERAYADVFTILSARNACSDFYGGAPAVIALNQLVQRLKPVYFEQNTAIRMSGETTIVQNNRTGRVFRFFDNAEVNLAGAFFKDNSFHSVSKTPPIGDFPPNTREARVTILLHELGHMIRRPDKNWLLPDDGKSADLSRQNTWQVIDVCREEISHVTQLDFIAETTSARAIHGPLLSKAVVAAP